MWLLATKRKSADAGFQYNLRYQIIGWMKTGSEPVNACASFKSSRVRRRYLGRSVSTLKFSLACVWILRVKFDTVLYRLEFEHVVWLHSTSVILDRLSSPVTKYRISALPPDMGRIVVSSRKAIGAITIVIGRRCVITCPGHLKILCMVGARTHHRGETSNSGSPHRSPFILMQQPQKAPDACC